MEVFRLLGSPSPPAGAVAWTFERFSAMIRLESRSNNMFWPMHNIYFKSTTCLMSLQRFHRFSISAATSELLGKLRGGTTSLSWLLSDTAAISLLILASFIRESFPVHTEPLPGSCRHLLIELSSLVHVFKSLLYLLTGTYVTALVQLIDQ